jgi:hypothetical protein
MDETEDLLNSFNAEAIVEGGRITKLVFHVASAVVHANALEELSGHLRDSIDDWKGGFKDTIEATVKFLRGLPESSSARDYTSRQPTVEEFKELGLDPNDLGCVEEHPEGSDRGGYVPTLNNGCYYDENGGEWLG